nr:30S ribosomal protein S6e [Candidatus Woesearchaeota archaeon]
MPEFILTISKDKKSYKKAIDTDLFKGKKIGDLVPGNSLGLEGYELKITGGSDTSGFPMRPDLKIVGRRKILIVKGIGLRKNRKGIKRRKTVVGNQISLNTKQINLMVTKEGSKSIDEVFGVKQEEKNELQS